MGVAIMSALSQVEDTLSSGWIDGSVPLRRVCSEWFCKSIGSSGTFVILWLRHRRQREGFTGILREPNGLLKIETPKGRSEVVEEAGSRLLLIPFAQYESLLKNVIPPSCVCIRYA